MDDDKTMADKAGKNKLKANGIVVKSGVKSLLAKKTDDFYADGKLTGCNGGKVVRVHKVFMAEKSSYLDHKFKTAPAGDVIAVPVDTDTLANAVKLIYDGKVRVRESGEEQDLLACLRLLNVRFGTEVDKDIYVAAVEDSSSDEIDDGDQDETAHDQGRNSLNSSKVLSNVSTYVSKNSV
jgi:hypothetical protein